MSEQKSILRREYERILGRSISDRTWQRIRLHRLVIADEYDISQLPEVRIYAWLVKQNPRGKIGQQHIKLYKGLVQSFPVMGGSGDDLYHAISKHLQDEKGNSPAKSTIYQWGYQLGVPLYRHKHYSGFEVWKWIRFLIGKKKYQPVCEGMKSAA